MKCRRLGSDRGGGAVVCLPEPELFAAYFVGVSEFDGQCGAGGRGMRK